MTTYLDTGALLLRSDGACVPKDPRNIDYLSALASGAITVAAPADPAVARLSAAWQAADTAAREGIDDNARLRFVLWLIDPTSSAERRARIAACLAWADAIWADYATVKASILAGRDTRIATPSPCPYTFWEIASA